ncbi:TonB family protein [Myxococcaceae bacterium GXIMD 01537]
MALCLLLPAGARAADGGTPDAGTLAEVGVARTDAGYALEGGGAPDAGVEPSFRPPALLADSPAPYPPQLAAERVTGTVRLELLVDEAGEVESASLVQGLHPLLDAAALHAAPGLRFTPAQVDGVAVPVRLGFEYRFEAPQEAPAEVAAPAPVTLKGLVRAKGNRRPLPGAVLVPEAHPDHPVTTGADGRFEARLPPGPQWVRVTAPGHKPGRFQENVRAGEALEVVYGLEPLVLNPYETVVRGDRERTEVSRVTLHDAELREVPGTMGDPFRVVMLLPGVGSVLSGVAYPVVRGSQPASTGYFLDGIRVPILFHLFLGPAVLHPDFIDAIDFFPGTPPPQYGRLMGGAIDGRLSKPRDDRVHGSASLDLINAGGFVEYPFTSTGTNVSVAGRYSYTPWLIALAANALQPPPPPGRLNDKLVLDFWDYQARIEQEVGAGRVRFFAFGSSDTFGTEAQDAFGSTSLQRILFHRMDLRLRQPLGPGEFEAGVTWGLDRLGITSETSEAGGEFNVDQRTLSARAGYFWKVDSRLSLRAGADLESKRAVVSGVSRELEVGASPREVRVDVPLALATFSGAWGELAWTPDERWTVVGGLRLDNYHLSPGLNHVALEPRVTVRHRRSDTLVLKGGAGLFHQPPTTLISLPVVDVAGLRQGLQRGLQLSAGAEWKPLSQLDVNVEVYVNPMLRTVELTPFADDSLINGPSPVGDNPMPLPEPEPFPEPPSRGLRAARQDLDDLEDIEVPELPDLSGRGLAYGLEVLVRHPLGGNWFGWLSYTLQRSTRLTRFTRHDARGERVGEVEEDLPFAFDQTHVLNLVLSYKFANNFTLGAVFHFNSGRPEYAALGQQTHREGLGADGSPAWVRVDRDQVDRLPGFFRFDLRLAKAWTYDTFSMEASLDMLNVTINQEVVAFNYEGGAGRPLIKEAVGVPIVLPILGLKGRY